jgi:hypothetical protein
MYLRKVEKQSKKSQHCQRHNEVLRVCEIMHELSVTNVKLVLHSDDSQHLEERNFNSEEHSTFVHRRLKSNAVVAHELSPQTSDIGTKRQVMIKPKFCRPGQESYDARDMHMDPQ